MERELHNWRIAGVMSGDPGKFITRVGLERESAGEHSTGKAEKEGG